MERLAQRAAAGGQLADPFGGVFHVYPVADFCHNWRPGEPSAGAGRMYLCWLPAVYLTLLHVVFVSSLRYREPAMLALLALAAGGC